MLKIIVCKRLQEKMGMIRQNYNLVDGINFSAEAKQFTYEKMKRNILRQCKN